MLCLVASSSRNLDDGVRAPAENGVLELGTSRPGPTEFKSKSLTLRVLNIRPI